ncbi:golgi uridine diphosphate-N-acetylglucosamine transporter, partial [Elasticomyces elasticus]
PLITFVQFILTALFTSPNFFSISAGPRSLFLNPRAIPLRSWMMYTAYFVTINLLNNWAFAYKISVPLHIIVRSGGPVASMVVGYLFNARRYSWGQIMSVFLLTLGVVGAAMADAEARGQSINVESADSSAMVTTIVGFSILALAMVLSAFQGIFADRLYEKYGRDHWKEALFYSHTLSLPLFIATYPQLLNQWEIMVSSPPLLSKLPDIASLKSGGQAFTSPNSISESITGLVSSTITAIHQYEPFQSVLAGISTQVAYLLINALTQFLCIRGVHLLSAKTSSLTVTIVLNIRKLVSLLLSIYLFGNQLAPGVLFGAALVFAGGGLYGFEGARLREKSITLKKD